MQLSRCLQKASPPPGSRMLRTGGAGGRPLGIRPLSGPSLIFFLSRPGASWARPVGHSTCLPRKEVIQPHLPVRLPCYDFTPLTLHTFDASVPRGGSAGGFGCRRLGWCDGRCVQGPGTHSPRRADPRLLATPASCRRVAACSPNWGRLSGIRSPSRGGNPLCRPL